MVNLGSRAQSATFSFRKCIVVRSFVRVQRMKQRMNEWIINEHCEFFQRMRARQPARSVVSFALGVSHSLDAITMTREIAHYFRVLSPAICALNHHSLQIIFCSLARSLVFPATAGTLHGKKTPAKIEARYERARMRVHSDNMISH